MHTEIAENNEHSKATTNNKHSTCREKKHNFHLEEEQQEVDDKRQHKSRVFAKVEGLCKHCLKKTRKHKAKG